MITIHGALQAVRTSGGNLDLVTVLSQALPKIGGSAGFVFYNQDFHVLFFTLQAT